MAKAGTVRTGSFYAPGSTRRLLSLAAETLMAVEHQSTSFWGGPDGTSRMLSSLR